MFVRVSILVLSIVFSAARSGTSGEPASAGLLRPAQAAGADRPSQAYSPLHAAEDAHRAAEERRRWAIDRQLELLGRIRQSHSVAADARALSDYLDAVRHTLRRRYTAPLPGAAPRYGGAIPFDPPVQQPLGHERIWTGPNSYIYKPIFPGPFELAPDEAVPPPAVPWNGSAAVPPHPLPREARPAPGDVPEIPEPPAAPFEGPREL